MSEEGEEWFVDLLISVLLGFGVLIGFKNLPDNLLGVSINLGDMILNKIHASGQGLPLSPDFRQKADFLYLVSQTCLNLIHFSIGFFPTLGIRKFKRKRSRKKRQNYWN